MLEDNVIEKDRRKTVDTRIISPHNLREDFVGFRLTLLLESLVIAVEGGGKSRPGCSGNGMHDDDNDHDS